MTDTARSVVLVVDDVQKNIALMRAVLAPAGYEVLTATDGPLAEPYARLAERLIAGGMG